MSLDEIKEMIEKLVTNENVLIDKRDDGTVYIENVITKETKELTLIPF